MNFIRNHPILIVFVLLLAVIAGYSIDSLISQQAMAHRQQAPQPTLVAVKPVAYADMIDQIESVGTAFANESVTLTAKVTETVRKVNFEDGMWVNEGDILLELTNAEETAMLAEAKATVDETTRQFQRVKNLIDQKLASQTALDVERARMETANARLEATVARLDDRLIRAPFSGLLGFRRISQGTLLTPSTPVTTIDDVSIIKADFSVPERYLSDIVRGQQIFAKSTAWPAHIFKGEVHTVNSRIDPVTRSITVRAHINNDDLKLRPGMLLNIELVVNQVRSLVVPEEAIVPIQDRSYVYLVGAAVIAERTEIVTGRRDVGIVEVVSGLSEGDLVVTQGVIKISPGSPVRMREVAKE